MLVAWMDGVVDYPAMGITGGLYIVSKNLFVLSLMKPTALRIIPTNFSSFGFYS